MNNPAINLINPAAACPDWCTAEHDPEEYAAPVGWWDITHSNEVARVPAVNDDTFLAAETELRVFVSSFITEGGTGDLPPLVCLERWDHDGDFGLNGSFRLTTAQAVRLAEVLVRQAAALLALQSTDENGTAR